MEVDKDRMKREIDYLASLNDTPDNGTTRFSYSENDQIARNYLIEQFNMLGLNIRIDGVGNMFATYEGNEPSLPAIYVGSHIDSVKNGGRFDGVVGVIAALEAVRVMKSENHKPKHSIVISIFAEEEGSNFQVPVMGSKILVGKLSLDDIKTITNPDGLSAYDVIKNAGYNPDNISNEVLKKGSIKAMLEMHIEQSVRLDKERHPVGIVNGIAGLQWLKVKLIGCTNHAGATPMYLRNDPLVMAGKMIADIYEKVKEISDTTVATVGHIEVKPNIANAIPGDVVFTVDIRDINQSGIDRMVDAVYELAEVYSNRYGVKAIIEKLAKSETIKIEQYIIDIMLKNANELGIDCILMPSGAVHDSNYMAMVTDVGMIFVPSIDGRSHVNEEQTDWDDIKTGGDLLLATLLDLSS